MTQPISDFHLQARHLTIGTVSALSQSIVAPDAGRVHSVRYSTDAATSGADTVITLYKNGVSVSADLVIPAAVDSHEHVYDAPEDDGFDVQEGDRIHFSSDGGTGVNPDAAVTVTFRR